MDCNQLIWGRNKNREVWRLEEQVIRTVKYADDVMLLAKEEMLQEMIDRLIEIGRCSGMDMNVGGN